MNLNGYGNITTTDAARIPIPSYNQQQYQYSPLFLLVAARNPIPPIHPYYSSTHMDLIPHVAMRNPISPIHPYYSLWRATRSHQTILLRHATWSQYKSTPITKIKTSISQINSNPPMYFYLNSHNGISLRLFSFTSVKYSARPTKVYHKAPTNQYKPIV